MAINTSEIATRLFKKLLGLGETSSSNKEFYEELYNGPLTTFNNNVWTDINKIPTSLSGTTNVVNLPIGSYINLDGTTGLTKNNSVLQVSAWTLNIVVSAPGKPRYLGSSLRRDLNRKSTTPVGVR
jgi:hypothetical protein